MRDERYLATKLTRPRVPHWHLERPQLTSMLQEGLSRRLTLLLGAAGYGKTATSAYFFAHANLPCLWLQLDANDSELPVFASYLAQGVLRDLGGGARMAQALRNQADFDQLLSALVNDVDERRTHMAIVLDDFHLIRTDSLVHPFIEDLLTYTGEWIHLYICSRTVVPFSTARLRICQEVAEITEQHFRFTHEEVRIFLHEATGACPSDDDLAVICHMTEGWPAALVLLATEMKQHGLSEPMLPSAPLSVLSSYFMEEFINTLPADLQPFAEESSIFDTCSAAACDFVMNRCDSAQMIQRLLNTHLLLTLVHTDTVRYHRLLQRFLQERLRQRDDGQRFRELHRRAGDWYRSRQMHKEALTHYLAGEWIDQAAQVVEQLAPLWLRTSQLDWMGGLLAPLPPHERAAHPWISLYESRQLLNGGNLDAAMGMARIALRAFEQQHHIGGVVQAQTLIGEIYLFVQRYDEAIRVYNEAVQRLQPDQRFEACLLLQRHAALAVLLQESYREAEADLRKALALAVELGDRPSEAQICHQLGTARASLGDYRSSLQFLERSIDIFRSLGEKPYELGLGLAWLYTQLSRFGDAVSICERLLISSMVKRKRAYAAIYLVYAYSRLAHFAKAEEAGQIAYALVEELGTSELKSDLLAYLSGRYRLAHQGELAIPLATEALHGARKESWIRPYLTATIEVVLLHLFHTGHTAAAARMATRALTRMRGIKIYPLRRMMLGLALAVTAFRLARTESKSKARKVLQRQLSECGRRGYEFFALAEWPLAFTVVIYGLTYGVRTDLCLKLMVLMSQQLPEAVVQDGIHLMEPEVRLLPTAWQALTTDAVRESFARLLGPQSRYRLTDMTEGPAPLQIRCLGALAVTVGAHTVDIKALKKRKSGQLLVLLLAQEDPISRDQVIDRLWPDLEPDSADASLRVSIHHLRRLLEPHLGGRSRSRYIHTQGGLVWFGRPPEVQVDLDQFRAALAHAHQAAAAGDLATAATHYEEACHLYRGDLSTNDPYSIAVEDLARNLRQQYAAALEWLGRYYWHETRHAERAIALFRRRLALDEAHEPAHQEIMRIYLQSGQAAMVRQQYDACRQALAVGVGMAPSPATEALLQQARS